MYGEIVKFAGCEHVTVGGAVHDHAPVTSVSRISRSMTSRPYAAADTVSDFADPADGAVKIGRASSPIAININPRMKIEMSISARVNPRWPRTLDLPRDVRFKRQLPSCSVLAPLDGDMAVFRRGRAIKRRALIGQRKIA